MSVSDSGPEVSLRPPYVFHSPTQDEHIHFILMQLRDAKAQGYCVVNSYGDEWDPKDVALAIKNAVARLNQDFALNAAPEASMQVINPYSVGEHLRIEGITSCNGLRAACVKAIMNDVRAAEDVTKRRRGGGRIQWYRQEEAILAELSSGESYQFVMPPSGEDFMFVFEQLYKAKSEGVPVVNAQGEEFDPGHVAYAVQLAVQKLNEELQTFSDLSVDIVDKALIEFGVTRFNGLRDALIAGIMNTIPKREHDFMQRNADGLLPIQWTTDYEACVQQLNSNVPREEIQAIDDLDNLAFVERYGLQVHEESGLGGFTHPDLARHIRARKEKIRTLLLGE
jgi:hypothetical protein